MSQLLAEAADEYEVGADDDDLPGIHHLSAGKFKNWNSEYVGAEPRGGKEREREGEVKSRCELG